MQTPDISYKDKTWFSEARFGMFIHWGTYSMAARHEWVKKHECISEEHYQRYFEHFDPDRFNPTEWARQAYAAGMRYAVITTKHHEGFCLFDSKYTDYKATNTPAGRDLLREFVDAFRAAGLRIGFYYSLLDWHHPHYRIDRMHPRSLRTGTQADFDRINEGRDGAIYAQYMRDQVTELLTNYGQVDLLWLDFSFPGDYVANDPTHGAGPGKGRADWESEKFMDVVQKLQPQCLVNNRLDLPGNGDFLTPEQVQPHTTPVDEHGNAQVWEGCQTFSGAWGYHRDEQDWKSLRMLLWMLIDGVSKGGNLLLNVGPTARGEFDYRAVERLEGMGKWMSRHSRSIHGCTFAPAGYITPQDCRYTYNPKTNRLYLHVFNWPMKSIHLVGLGNKIAYAQLLNDYSEIRFRDRDAAHDPSPGRIWENCMLELPIQPPPVEVPVIELFLK
ncbi:MAG: alpha-L-fucosidase [Verrucomicrobiota bacterium]|nr:alpha-L-fucosidase [Verrucomicrobiota bacterium]